MNQTIILKFPNWWYTGFSICHVRCRLNKLWLNIFLHYTILNYHNFFISIWFSDDYHSFIMCGLIEWPNQMVINSKSLAIILRTTAVANLGKFIDLLLLFAEPKTGTMTKLCSKQQWYVSIQNHTEKVFWILPTGHLIQTQKQSLQQTNPNKPQSHRKTLLPSQHSEITII